MTHSKQGQVYKLNRATKRDRRIARLAQRLANLALDQAIEVAQTKPTKKVRITNRMNGTRKEAQP